MLTGPGAVANVTAPQLHFHDTDICAAAFAAQVALLRRDFEIVHTHANNYGGLSATGLPLTWELTMLHKDLLERPARPYTGPLSARASTHSTPDIFGQTTADSGWFFALLASNCCAQYYETAQAIKPRCGIFALQYSGANLRL